MRALGLLCLAGSLACRFAPAEAPPADQADSSPGTGGLDAAGEPTGDAGFLPCGVLGGACCLEQPQCGESLLCQGAYCTCVARLAAGGAHTCALRLDGSVACWGMNAQGQLGDGTNETRETPVAVSELTDAVELVAGSAHTCARRGDGTVWCWGAGALGQLGNGGIAARSTPTQVTGLAGAIALAAGENHTCAVKMGGGVTCWGSNVSGQLGNGGTAQSNSPSVVLPLGATSISAGGDHTCARQTNGQLACWGDNTFGQLGDQSHTDRLTPAAVVQPAEVTGFDEVALGSRHSCARAGTNVYCWGDNQHGQLGTGFLDSLDRPTHSLVYEATSLTAGADHTCVVRTSPGFQCWGRNGNGQLGDGLMVDSPAPQLLPVPATTGAAGGAHTCVRTDEGVVLCWGANGDGQLGNGSQQARSVPTATASPCPGPG